MLSDNRIQNISSNECPSKQRSAQHIENQKTRQDLIDDAMQNPQFLKELATPDHPRVVQLVPTIPSETICSVLPPPPYVPSNPRAPTAPDRILYVNGMRVDAAGIRRDLCQIAVCFGRRTTAVINPPERPLFKYDSDGFMLSVRNALGGYFSTSLGMALERDTIATLIEEVKNGVIGKGERILILAHSQGSIITGNAFEILFSANSDLTEEEKEIIRTHVTVTVIGAAQRRFPAGIESEELAHSGDLVPRITVPVSYLQHGLGVGVQTVKDWVAGYKEQWEVAKRVHDVIPQIPSTEWAEKVVLSGGHSLQSYLDNLHLFFVERAKDSKGSVDSVLLADRYVRSVWQGEYSDVVYCRIVKNRIESIDTEFAKQLINKCSVNGRIGNFQVPSFDILKELSSREPHSTESEDKTSSESKEWYTPVKNWFSSVRKKIRG